ncbi:T9SS type A sorting domain-containing protein [Lacinutrix gracilariae]|uniref:T9SS type A sorting domain-containing protein n=1 Tax=Lacinutrix gracilariae TaxID=1747198 RepID=A0ABW5JX30_9FLAO
MKKITLIIFLLLFTFNSYSQDFIEPTLKESFALNSHTNRDVAYFSVIDGNENIISIATTERDSSFTDILTTKLDSNLNQLWQKRFSLENDLSYDIPLNSFLDTNNNIYITGRSATKQSSQNGLLFVIKYDTEGNELWHLNIDDYNDSESDDYFYQNSFLDDNGLLHIVHAKSNETNTAAKFHFYTISESGNIITSFYREDIIDYYTNNFTGITYEIFYKNDEYYMRYRRHNLTSSPSFYEHFIKKINNTTIETYPLNSFIDLNDTDLFYKGIIEVDSNSNIYLTYPLENSNKFKLLKLDNAGNLSFNIESPDNYDKDTFAVNINSNGNLSFLCNSKLSTSSESKTLNLLEYDNSGNIITDLSASSTFINGLKYYSENSILVYSNGNFKLFDQSLNLTNEFLGSYNNFNDFNLINNSNIAISRTTFSQMYPGSDFSTQQDLEIQKIDTNQILNTYSYSGEGTSKAFKQKIIIDNLDNYIVASEEKLGPDNWSIGGSRAPVTKTIYKYNSDLTLLWALELDNFIVNTHSSNERIYVIDNENNLFINSMINVNSHELIKISPSGVILYQVPSVRSINMYLDQNNNINLSTSVDNDITYDDDTIIYTINNDDGSLLNAQTFEGLNFLDSYISSNGDSYIYMYTGSNSYNDTSPKLNIYKNFNLEFETNLAITGTYGGISSYSVDDNGNINFSSSWGQINAKIHRITLNNTYNYITLSNKIKQVISTPNNNIFTLNDDGYIKIYDNNLNLLSTSIDAYYNQPYLRKVGNHIFFNTYFDNIVKVFDENAVEISEFKLPSSLSFIYASTDSINNLILTGQNGYQISTNHEYSWARGFIHKYNFSSFNLSVNDNNILDDSLSIFPNPTNSIITINSVKNSIFKVSIYDINGRFLFQTNNSSIDISDLPSSIYLLKIVLDNGNIINRKIVKK